MVNYSIGDALIKGIALLNDNKIDTAGIDARMLLCKVLDCDKLYLTVHRDDVLTSEDSKAYFDYICRRIKREPVSYITGVKEFMSMDFEVCPGILIPRPDTEILVERVIEENTSENPVIVDMCTGSGAIAVSLAKYIPGSRVYGLDISSDALRCAKSNALRNGVEVEFCTHDVLTPYEGVMADIVVSNPPYIPTDELATLESDVVDYEPMLALDGGPDGLVFYRAIAENISSCLKKGGLLAFEVGCGIANGVAELMKDKFHSITIEKDLAGIDRVVSGRLKEC